MRHAIHVRRSKCVHEVSHSERHPFSHGAAEMLVSFLRRRLGSVLLVLHRNGVVCCATGTAALTVMVKKQKH